MCWLQGLQVVQVVMGAVKTGILVKRLLQKRQTIVIAFHFFENASCPQMRAVIANKKGIMMIDINGALHCASSRDGRVNRRRRLNVAAAIAPAVVVPAAGPGPVALPPEEGVAVQVVPPRRAEQLVTLVKYEGAHHPEQNAAAGLGDHAQQGPDDHAGGDEHGGDGGDLGRGQACHFEGQHQTGGVDSPTVQWVG